ncbi:hypothetical protein [Paraburkholderia tropica]|uniref:hypothetical protein n=1 Tax=Paraburkholderia tropica TaxID=92647 RepID=UPI002AB70E96|nr:hypothetical protein [Paraburkholderia tropica]
MKYVDTKQKNIHIAALTCYKYIRSYVRILNNNFVFPKLKSCDFTRRDVCMAGAAVPSLRLRFWPPSPRVSFSR